MNEPKYRHEFKHYINFSDYLAVKNRIKALAVPDAFARSDGTYRIRSLYFDNLYDKALLEKINGVNRREKFRIRCYNDDFRFIKLEKKSKIHGLCLKQAEKLTEEEVTFLLSGNFDFLKHSSKDSLKFELYSKMNSQQLRPKTLVDYTREAFVYPTGNVRVTLDSDIRTGMYSTDFLNYDLPTVRTGSDIILEVKYDEFLPRILADAVQIPGRKTTAFSKYAACRIFRP